MNFTEVIYRDGIYKIYDDGVVEFPTCPIESVVQGLSREGRFSNQTPKHYSVAEHSVNVANRLMVLTGDVEIASEGLWHEAGEALGWRDVNGLLANKWGKKWKKGEMATTREVFRRLGLNWPIREIVKQVDYDFAVIEGLQLLGHSARLWEGHTPSHKPILQCWNPERAAAEFRQLSRELNSKRIPGGVK